MIAAFVDALALVSVADAEAVVYEASVEGGTARRWGCDGGGDGRCSRDRGRRTSWVTHPHPDVRMALKPGGMCPRKDSDRSVGLAIF